MGWGGYGTTGIGGAQTGDNYRPDAIPYRVRTPDPYLTAMRDQARDFANDTAYRGPNGKFVTHYMDPFTGNIRQLIEESRSSNMADKVALLANEANLGADAREHAAWLKWLDENGQNRRPGIVG